MGNSSSRPIICNEHDETVSPSLRFSRQREMVVASIFTNLSTIMIFPSEHSFDRYKKSGRKIRIQSNLENDGLGVPLLECDDKFLSQTVSGASKPRYRIYKNVLQPEAQKPPHPNCSIVCEDKTRAIYRMPFCEVYKEIRGTRTSYRYVFYTPDGLQEVLLKRHRFSQNMDTRLGEWNVGWRLRGSGDFDLKVIPANMPTLLEDKEIRKAKKASSTREDATDAILWAKYLENSGLSMPQMVRKRVSLHVGETSFETDAAAYGLIGVPWFSQVIACMGMVLCFLETEERLQST
ncbi:LANO_0H23376g1_1 [Lachancea nothofagi CBS 11611]|uniref:LANO_0H23376g1_1 n=1 Tax=Lachancea nothofagi CBS 11611 TaxID=1266666 RepID=A0A1G4KNM3_9SACH|nr:LANO_0H23376g1_1 [Lachancea nothofagi CBS 11611]